MPQGIKLVKNNLPNQASQLEHCYSEPPTLLKMQGFSSIDKYMTTDQRDKGAGRDDMQHQCSSYLCSSLIAIAFRILKFADYLTYFALSATFLYGPILQCPFYFIFLSQVDLNSQLTIKSIKLSSNGKIYERQLHIRRITYKTYVILITKTVRKFYCNSSPYYCGRSLSTTSIIHIYGSLLFTTPHQYMVHAKLLMKVDRFPSYCVSVSVIINQLQGGHIMCYRALSTFSSL